MKNINYKPIIRFVVEMLVAFIILFAVRCVVTDEYFLKGIRPLALSSLLLTLGSCFYTEKKSYWLNALVLVAAISSVLFIKIFTQEIFNVGMYNELLSFAVGITNALLLIFAWLNDKGIYGNIKYLILYTVFLPVLFLWGYYIASGSWVSVDTVMAVLQTNLSESSEYLSDTLAFPDWLILIVLGILIGCIGYNATKLKTKNILKYGSLLLTIFILGNIFFAYRHRKNVITDIAIQASAYAEKYKDFEKKRLARKESAKQYFSDIDSKAQGVYVLVIGESQNRNNMSAYGYARETTPWLNSVKQNDNFILFNNVYSCHTHTVPVLTYALTAKNQYNDLNLGQSSSLLEVVEAAGFDTVWISNQVKYSAWDTPITVIADEANQQFWHNNNVGEKTATNHYDLKLVESIDRLKLSDKMLIVFHLMGNHGSYRERYPKEFRKFTGNSSLDEYDNSILYNDYVMHTLYEKVKMLPNFKGMVYFADHADAVQQNLAHDASRFVFEMTHVPMYMYFSDAYVLKHNKKYNELTAKKDSVLTNDLIFNTMLSIMDINISNIYESHNDIISKGYDDNVERFTTLYGKKKLLDERL